jgi:2-polyprenyl-3-methyl-5-hydroxy-6-metoxy-1,4-benzoquinol methylase
VNGSRGDQAAEPPGRNLPPPTNDEVRALWDAIADYWDQQMEAGATMQRPLIQPAVERMLALRPGERVLEIACGNGEFSRRMSELGAHVLATDFSQAMLDRARSHGGDVEYRRVDAVDGAALRGLGDRAFDAVVCNQAIMDIADIEPMASAIPALLAAGGRFVFSTMHPAFNSNDAVRVIEQSEDGSGVVRAYGVKVMGYATPSAAKGVALEGQPVTHWYFHRSLTDLLGPFFAHGLVVDGLDEPVLDPDGIRPGSMSMIFTEIPLVVVGRMRVAGER